MYIYIYIYIHIYTYILCDRTCEKGPPQKEGRKANI